MNLKESIVIGILGRQRVGKDTVALKLIDTFRDDFPNIKSVTFRCGDYVKIRLAQLTGGSHETIEENKTTDEGRWLLENFGTYLGEESILKHITKQIDAALPQKMLILITGLRRRGEVDVIRYRYNGIVICVLRKTGLPVQPTEADINNINYDYPLANDGSLLLLDLYVRDAYQYILHHSKIKPKYES